MVGTENDPRSVILDSWTRSHSQSGLLEQSASPRFPSKNWPLSRVSLRLTTSKLCLERGCPKTNQRRNSPQACASGVEKVPVPPTRNECRHRRHRRGVDALQRRHSGDCLPAPHPGAIARNLLYDACRVGALAARARLGKGTEARTSATLDTLRCPAGPSRTVWQM